MLYPNKASSGPYLDSAHGSSSYGVSRTSTAIFSYSRGNCAHCHEQHASIGGTEPDPVTGPQGYELFYDHWIDKCDLFCYECHRGTGYVQTEAITNYLYSCNYGGEACTTYPSVRQHFCSNNSEDANCGSRHHLGQISTVIKNDANGWGYPVDPDPCSACHNPHLSQRKGNKQYKPPYNAGKSSIVRPSEHKSNPLNLWGDGSGEKMSDYITANGGTYQAPYYGNTTSGFYEPSGNNTPSDGSDLPDYVTFCMDCHKNEQYDPERSTTVKAIKWRNADPAPGKPDRYGEYPSNTCVPGFGEAGSLRPPYSDFANSNYVLSCTDCHEPHAGRKRLHLIRRFINGEAVAADAGTRAAGTCDTSPDDPRAICERCHTIDSNHRTWSCGVNHCHDVSGLGGFHRQTWDGSGGCNGEPVF